MTIETIRKAMEEQLKIAIGHWHRTAGTDDYRVAYNGLATLAVTIEACGFGYDINTGTVFIK